MSHWVAMHVLWEGNYRCRRYWGWNYMHFSFAKLFLHYPLFRISWLMCHREARKVQIFSVLWALSRWDQFHTKGNFQIRQFSFVCWQTMGKSMDPLGNTWSSLTTIRPNIKISLLLSEVSLYQISQNIFAPMATLPIRKPWLTRSLSHKLLQKLPK